MMMMDVDGCSWMTADAETNWIINAGGRALADAARCMTDAGCWRMLAVDAGCWKVAVGGWTLATPRCWMLEGMMEGGWCMANGGW